MPPSGNKTLSCQAGVEGFGAEGYGLRESERKLKETRTRNAILAAGRLLAPLSTRLAAN